jgi:hypothetical protein
MSAKTRWAVAIVVAVGVVLAILALTRPGAPPAPRLADTPSGKSPPFAAAEPKVPAPAAPKIASATAASQSAPASSAPLARYSLAEDLPGDDLGRKSAITGRVTDRLGKPIERAQVHAKGVFDTGSTFKDGSYFLSHLEPGTYELVATHEDYSDSNRETVSAGSSGVNFMLRPLGSIEGRVVSARDGQPITEFRIRPERVADSPDLEETKFTRLRDNEGRFTLDRVKAGTAGVAVGAMGFADVVTPFAPLRPGETRQGLEVRLDTGAELQGRVVDSAGRGVKLAQVSGGTPRRGAVSEADGSFHLDSLPSGRFEVTVKHEDYAPKVVEVFLAGGVNRTQIVLTEGGVLEGEITLGGKGVPGDVLLRMESGLTLSAHAGEDGHYRMKGVPDGSASVDGTIEPSNVCDETWRKSVKINIAGGVPQAVDFNFPPNAARVQGTVYMAPGTPYRGGARLIASYPDFTADGATLAHVDAKLNTDGTFSLCLPGGEIGLSLFLMPDPGFDGPKYKSVTLNLGDGEHLQQDFLLYGASKLQVTVVGDGVDFRTTVMVIRGEVAVGEITDAFLKSVSVVGGESIDARGMMTVWGLEAGTYTILVGAYPSPEETKQGARPKTVGSAVVNVGKDQNLAVSIPVTVK